MDKVCAIVGFGPGNGMALARAFGAEGHRLALLSRSRAKHAASLQALEAENLSANFFETNAADPESLGSAFEAVRAEVGAPSVLIYNAFAMRLGQPSKLRPEDLIEDLRTNVGGALAATHAVLPAMRAAGRGKIFFTGGGFALEPLPQVSSVGIGKAALRNLALALAKELAPEGIHVGTVTIHGMVKAGTHFAPEKIAQSFLELYRDAPGGFRRELDYK